MPLAYIIILSRLSGYVCRRPCLSFMMLHITPGRFCGVDPNASICPLVGHVILLAPRSVLPALGCRAPGGLAATRPRERNIMSATMSIVLCPTPEPPSRGHGG